MTTGLIGIAANYDTATNEMVLFLQTPWLANAAAIVGSVTPLTLLTPDSEVTTAPSLASWYGRVSFKTASSKVTSLANAVASNDSRRYTILGTMFVQVFGPNSNANGNKNARLLAQYVQQILRSRPGPADVNLTNVRFKEIGSDSKYYQYNVLADYKFDEIG